MTIRQSQLLSNGIVGRAVLAARTQLEARQAIGSESSVAQSLVITTGQMLPLDKRYIYFTPPAGVQGPPSDFSGDESQCALHGFSYNDPDCDASGSGSGHLAGFYYQNAAALSLELANAVPNEWIYTLINPHATQEFFVLTEGAAYPSDIAFSVPAQSTLEIQKVAGVWRVVVDSNQSGAVDVSGKMDKAGGEFTGPVTGEDITLSGALAAGSVSTGTATLSEVLKMSGQTVTPTGSAATINLATKQTAALHMTSGSGTCTVTITPPTSGITAGQISIRHHATTVRDLVFVSSATIEWINPEPDWETLATNSKTLLGYFFDGSTLHLSAGSGTGATNLSVSRDGTSVTVESDTGTNAALPVVDGTDAGILTGSQYAAILASMDITSLRTMNVGAANGWASSGNLFIEGSDGSWTDGNDESWSLSSWIMTVGEASGALGTTVINLHPIDGAYFAHGGVSIGVFHDFNLGEANYLIGSPGKFRDVLGLGSMSLQNVGSYFSAAGGTLTGQLLMTRNSMVSSPAQTLTGTWFTGGTATTTKPHVLLEPAGVTSTAWSTSGTGLGVNATSGFVGNLIDLQSNGNSRFRVAGNGAITTGGSVNVANSLFLATGVIRAAFGVSTVLGDAIGTSTDNFAGLYLRAASKIAFSNIIGISEESGVLEVNSTTSGQFRDLRARNYISTLTTPASASASGVSGTITADANYVYVCTASNTWKRVAVSTW